MRVSSDVRCWKDTLSLGQREAQRPATPARSKLLILAGKASPGSQWGSQPTCQAPGTMSRAQLAPMWSLPGTPPLLYGADAPSPPHCRELLAAAWSLGIALCRMGALWTGRWAPLPELPVPAADCGTGL